MLEWYRTYANLEVIIEDIQGLLNHLIEWQVFPQQDVLLKQVTMKELFQRFLDFDLQSDTDRRQLLQECEKWQIPVTGDELWNDLFHLLFLIKIEPLLSEMGPLIVKNFPPSQAALARLTESGWADRFEFYWQGLEIANAFNELNDPEEQLRRCYRDNREREDRGRQPLPLDTDFIQALKNGMPPSGGIALGLERFFMAGLGYHDIREVRPFIIEDSLYSLS